jgi:hypothetical protein
MVSKIGYGSLLADAVRQGLVTPAVLPPGPPPKRRPVARLDQILSELEGDRQER